MVEGAQDGTLARLPRRLEPQVGTPLGPGMGEVGVGQGFGLVSEQEPDVAGLGLLPQQVETETGARDRLGILAAYQGVAWPAPGEAPFCRIRMLSRDSPSRRRRR